MTEENVKGASADAEAPNENAEELMPEDVTQEANAEPEATDAPEGVADVENVPDEAAPEMGETPAADANETVAGPDPPEAEPATDEPESASADAEALGEEDAQTPASSVSSSAKPKKKRLPRPLRRQRTKTTRERPAERKAITRLPKPEHARGPRQERQGTVVSAASDKTIVVRVDTVKAHPMYKKVIRRSTKLHAHDEGNQAKAGDIVRIVETRPLSKQKRWRLQEIIEAAK
jgi:small subunit ribosomal protein S17